MPVASALQSQSAAPPQVIRDGLPVHRFTVNQYERMAELGFLTSADRVELLEGVIVDKMVQNPPHNATIEYVHDALASLIPAGWRVRIQMAIRVPPKSAPEPDLAVVIGPADRYHNRHPAPRDVALVVEVADSSLNEDRGRKQRIYARARIPVYWIVNLVHGIVEIYTDPKAGKSPAYQKRQDIRPGDSISVVIDGKEVGQVAVSDLLRYVV